MPYPVCNTGWKFLLISILLDLVLEGNLEARHMSIFLIVSFIFQHFKWSIFPTHILSEARQRNFILSSYFCKQTKEMCPTNCLFTVLLIWLNTSYIFTFEIQSTHHSKYSCEKETRPSLWAVNVWLGWSPLSRLKATLTSVNSLVAPHWPPHLYVFTTQHQFFFPDLSFLHTTILVIPNVHIITHYHTLPILDNRMRPSTEVSTVYSHALILSKLYESYKYLTNGSLTQSLTGLKRLCT